MAVHGIGALFAFFFGVVYMFEQAIFVAIMKPRLGSLVINTLRFILTIITAAALVIC